MYRALYAIFVVLGSGVMFCMADEKAKEGERDEPAIEVRIAIPVHHKHRSLNEYDHFHVLLTNRSESTLRVWTDRYSWGYDNLSFEMIDADGHATPIAKKPRDWGKNVPDFLVLEPGEIYVLNVKLFDEEVWAKIPTRPKGAMRPQLVKLRAVYQVSPDEESARHGVWTGKSASPAAEYAIW